MVLLKQFRILLLLTFFILFTVKSPVSGNTLPPLIKIYDIYQSKFNKQVESGSLDLLKIILKSLNNSQKKIVIALEQDDLTKDQKTLYKARLSQFKA